MEELTADDCRFILESLDYTKQKFRDYAFYPSYEFKQQRLSEVQAIILKVRILRDRLKAEREKQNGISSFSRYFPNDEC